jgi:hypothetical protein
MQKREFLEEATATVNTFRAKSRNGTTFSVKVGSRISFFGNSEVERGEVTEIVRNPLGEIFVYLKTLNNIEEIKLEECWSWED